MDQRNPFSAGDCGSQAAALEHLGNGWKGKVMAAAQLVSLAHGGQRFNHDFLRGINGRAEFLVADDPALPRIDSRCQGGRIHFRRADIGGMMVREGYPPPR